MLANKLVHFVMHVLCFCICTCIKNINTGLYERIYVKKRKDFFKYFVFTYDLKS